MIALIITCCILLIFGLTCSRNDISSPSVITSAVWLMCAAMFQWLDHDLPPLQTRTIVAIGIWASCLSFSSLFTQACHYSSSKLNEPSLLVRNIYLGLSVLTFPMLIQFAYSAITTGETGNWALDLRLAALGDTKAHPEPYENFFVLIWQVAFFLELIASENRSKKRIFLTGFIFIAYGFVTMSKIIITTSFIMATMILYMKKKISNKQIFYAALGMTGFIIVIQLLRHSQLNAGGESMLTIYTYGNMSSLDTVKPCSATHWGENTFRIFYAILHKLSIIGTEPIDPLLGWIEKPLKTNTYSGLYPFIKDFGIPGVAIAATLMGGMFGWIYKKAKSGNNYYIALYAFFINIIILQFVAEQFLTILSRNLKFIILLAIPFICTKHGLLYIKEKLKP
ncbi:MAG: oligosaccharide repeat unit polymerase [Paludibacteraceae bacterium]|nr:oligosaccharide repeat unit polymerase [Paludibacteraceae bacterium]